MRLREAPRGKRETTTDGRQEETERNHNAGTKESFRKEPNTKVIILSVIRKGTAG
jgi:hypothetical protein